MHEVDRGSLHYEEYLRPGVAGSNFPKWYLVKNLFRYFPPKNLIEKFLSPLLTPPRKEYFLTLQSKLYGLINFSQLFLVKLEAKFNFLRNFPEQCKIWRFPKWCSFIRKFSLSRAEMFPSGLHKTCHHCWSQNSEGTGWSGSSGVARFNFPKLCMV